MTSVSRAPADSEPESEPDAVPARRGRPVAVDSEAVALVALKMFDARGYDDVSMDEIAAAARISRRSLFRHFPRKGDLVWAGAEEAKQRITAALAQGDESASAVRVVADAYVKALDFEPDALEATRRRLLLIRRNPSLYEVARVELTAQREGLADFIARRERRPVESLHVQLLTDVVATAAFSTLVWWAEHGTGSPASDLVRAFGDLERTFGAGETTVG